MATKQKWPEWPLLYAWWVGEQLVKRRQKGETTQSHNVARALEWLEMIVHAAHREYNRRETLTKEVTDMKQQLQTMQFRLAQLESREQEADSREMEAHSEEQVAGSWEQEADSG